jgi:hypothetical protein
MKDFKQTEIIPVISRKFKNNEVIAFFPTEVDSYSQFECMSYMRIGQHGVARVELITTLKKCSVEEYTPLLNELKGIYTNHGNAKLYGDPVELEVVDKSQKKYGIMRLVKCKQLLGMK